MDFFVLTTDSSSPGLVESAIVDQNIAIGVPQFTNLVPSFFHSDDGFEQLSKASMCCGPSKIWSTIADSTSVESAIRSEGDRPTVPTTNRKCSR